VLILPQCRQTSQTALNDGKDPARLNQEAEFGAKRIILTHMSEEMMAHTDEVPEEAAYDGLVVNL